MGFNVYRLEDLHEMIDNGKLQSLAQHCPYCDKVSYEKEIEAQADAAKMANKGKGHFYRYECPKGKGWHLTTKKPNKSAVTPKTKKPSRSRRNRKDWRQAKRSQ